VDSRPSDAPPFPADDGGERGDGTVGDGEQTIGFEEDIKSLFRQKDRERMEWAFDLWDYDSVKENSDAILARLEQGDMPCDGEWPEEQIAEIRSWMDGGMAT
jgi:hypothetical protein